MIYRCLFEQSGHFKNELKKMGFEAFDYDILNDFGETDFQIDLYNEIEKAYEGGESIFDTFSSDDIVFAFFPCTRFEIQILLWFRGDARQQKNWTMEQKLEYCLKLHEELHRNYTLLCKLIIIMLKKNIPIIIENPYSTQNYLIKYFPIKPRIIDKNRHASGDYMKKPTSYWFIGIDPKNNLIFEPVKHKKLKTSNGMWCDKNYQVQRSMISNDYINRFLKEFVIEDQNTKQMSLEDYLLEENNGKSI